MACGPGVLATITVIRPANSLSLLNAPSQCAVRRGLWLQSLWLELGHTIIARRGDNFRPWSGRNIIYIYKAPSGDLVLCHAEIAPHSGRNIQSCFCLECVQRFDRTAEHKIKVVLATGSDVLPLGEARPTAPPHFNPTIFQKRRQAAMIPRHILNFRLQLTGLGKLPVWQSHVERVFLRSEVSRPVAIPMLRVIHSTVTQLPVLVPIAAIVGDKGVFRVSGFTHPKQGGHRFFELSSASQHKRLSKKCSACEAASARNELSPGQFHLGVISLGERSILLR